jgi:nuclear mRNA export protein SAC3
LAAKIDQVLKRERITPPSWPHIPPEGMRFNDPAMIKLYNDYKAYRDKVRTSLIRAGLLDDPDKPKKLSEALEFKGTCEDMCPEFERASRIMDGRIDPNEEGDPENMVKALARSAAGQDAPLPSDIRTAGALRRTIDHLFHDILGNSGLGLVHGFLWDRTRAIRRDFVFHSSMTPMELVDQVYCLEHITRFHVTALHQMSRLNLSADKFSEQQELEQLGKSLLSLIHTYEDCKAQRVPCENEAEFRAYYVLFNSHDPGILDTVQTWGYKFWKESEDIKIAIELVEALQNIWELHGPLKPHSATNIAQNGFSRFFTIIEDRKISYTLACFAEIFFNDVRKSVLKTILGSYRKQRDQTKDWTMSRLNTYLRFDNEDEVAPFLEAHGLRTDEIDGEEYLSFEVTEISDPWPKLKQTHSRNIVERKRGHYSLPEVIDRTVFNESMPEDEADEEEEEGLFVKDDSTPAQPSPGPVENLEEAQQARKDLEVVPNPTADQPAPVQNVQKSIFERMGSRSPATFSNGFFTPQTPETSPASQPPPPKTETSSIFGIKPASAAPAPATSSAPATPSFLPQLAKATQSIFSQPPKETTTTTPPIFSFSPQPPAQASTGNAQRAPISFSNPPTTSGTTQETKPTFFPTQQPPAALATPPANTQPAKNDQPTSPFSHLSRPAKNEQPKPPFGKLSQPLAFSSTPPSVPKPIESLSQNSTQSTPSLMPRTLPPKPSVEESAASQPKPLFGTKAYAPVDRSKGFDALSKWMTLGEDGLIDQFTAFNVEEILRQTMQSFMEQEAARAAQEADDQARREADRFRYRSLATKYGYRWREMAQRLWLKRKGREARQARREMAESMRTSKAAQSANIVEDFKASTSNRRRDSLESLLNATGVLNGVHDPRKEARAIVRSEHPENSHKRQRSERSSTSIASSTNRHKRGKSENPLRRSLLSDPSYLNGDSRIHLMSNYGAQHEGRRQVSGVQTDYFRLKARGITTLPDGTPLASSVAKNIIHQKRSFDGIQKSSTPQSSKHQPVARSVPVKFANHTEKLVNGNDREDLEALKIKAKAFVSEEKSRQKRTFADDDDEKLFERAKRVREKMDEGAEWYRKEIERETASRSVS